jgi:c-di-GMP-binding flagellar brake protein YcgR
VWKAGLGEAALRVQEQKVIQEEKELYPLSINDRVQVTLNDPGEENPVSFLSRVEDISGLRISLGWPTSEGIRAPLHPGDRLQVFLIKDAVYLMDCSVVGRVLSPIPLVLVQCQSSVRKAQRREYVRVSAKVKLYLSARVVKFGRHCQGDPVSRIETTTFSLSGAGFGIRYGFAPTIGNVYGVKMSSPEFEEPISANARVVRCESVEDQQSQVSYWVGFAFVGIKESDRRKIVSFVFRYQQTTIVP